MKRCLQMKHADRLPYSWNSTSFYTVRSQRIPIRVNNSHELLLVLSQIN